MGLRDLRRQVIEHEAVWWVRDWLRRALAGEKGPEMQKTVAWCMANKARIGSALIFLSGLIVAGLAKGTFRPSQGLEILAFVASYSGAAMLGAGGVKSDQYYRDRADDGNNR